MINLPNEKFSTVVKENSKPLVSVGLPTYNRATTLKRAIESVLAQDYRPLELIISDNGSTDDTQRICEQFCVDDSRIKYVRKSTNQGPLANFFETLRQANGKFFMWLGDDDWLDGCYVSRCAQELIEHPDYLLVCGRTEYFLDGQFVTEGETIDLLQDCAEARVLAFYQQVIHNPMFYGLMRRQSPHLAWSLKPALGWDWLITAAIAFMGKIETIKETSIHRSFAGVSRSVKAMISSMGLSRIHAVQPQLSIAMFAFMDIAWRSKAYASLGRWARLSLACKVFAVFSRRYLKLISRFVLTLRRAAKVGKQSG